MLRLCLLLAVAIISAGCGAELPEGWEDARAVDDFAQTDCSGSPYEQYEVTLSVERSLLDGLQVNYLNAHARCEQNLTAFWRGTDGSLSVLVQPQDMHPGAVAGCDCLYNLSMGLDTSAEAGTVTVFRRGDAINEPNDPVQVGQASF